MPIIEDHMELTRHPKDSFYPPRNCFQIPKITHLAGYRNPFKQQLSGQDNEKVLHVFLPAFDLALAYSSPVP
ncbi:hypothetical protein QL285_065451 [Trifolium repens]|nr:hypothetical protein QL285_065451 [Trifolium repens]